MEPVDKSKSSLDLIRDFQSQINSLSKRIECPEDQILRRLIQLKKDIVFFRQ